MWRVDVESDGVSAFCLDDDLAAQYPWKEWIWPLLYYAYVDPGTAQMMCDFFNIRDYGKVADDATQDHAG